MIFKLFKKYQSVIAYLFFGGLTTLINFVVFFIFDSGLHWNYQVANFIAWFLSVLFAFFTNKLFVFQSKSLDKKVMTKEILSFFFFRILSLGIDMLGMYICISLINLSKMLSKIIMNIIVIVANYVFSKIFIFKTKEES